MGFKKSVELNGRELVVKLGFKRVIRLTLPNDIAEWMKPRMKVFEWLILESDVARFLRTKDSIYRCIVLLYLKTIGAKLTGCEFYGISYPAILRMSRILRKRHLLDYLTAMLSPHFYEAKKMKHIRRLLKAQSKNK